MKSDRVVVSTVPVSTRLTSACAVETLDVLIFWLAAAASKVAKNTAVSLPSNLAVVISVSGVMFAIGLLPLPTTTLWSFVPSTGLVISNKHGL